MHPGGDRTALSTSMAQLNPDLDALGMGEFDHFGQGFRLGCLP